MAEAPKKSSLLRAALDALAHGNHTEAVRCCKQALKQDRHNYDAFLVLGKALFASKQYDQADMSYRRAVEINATGLRAWQGLAEVHEATGDFVKVVEACEAVIKICKSAGDLAHLAEYTRRLAVAHGAISDQCKARQAWQAVLEISPITDDLHLEALCGIVDAEAALLESRIQEECNRCLLRSKQLDAESVRQAVEDEWARSEESVKMEGMLWEISKQLPQAHKYENLLLHLLLIRMRTCSSSKGQGWKQPRIQVLQHCLTILTLHSSDLAVEVLLSMCEEDNMDELFLEIGMQQLTQGRANRILWLGKRLAHVYPDQGLVLSALAFAMHRSSSQSLNLGRKRSCCEGALRVEENSITGWQVLAELRAAEGAYSCAAECIRRGLQVIARLRSLYGLSLQSAELQLHLTSAESLLKMGSSNEACQVFQNIIKAAKGMQSVEGSKLLTSALEGQVKVLLAERNEKEASTMLSSLLAIDADNSWALAEQGWLAFHSGNLDQAVNHFEKAVTLRPENAGYHHRLGLLYWKSGSLLQSNKDKALGHLLESARLDPSQPEVFRILGHYYRDVPGGTNRAVRCYQKAVQLSPEDEEAGEALCDLLDSRGQELLESTICREASQRSPRAFWAWRRLGYIQVSRKEWSDAVGNLQHAVRGYPSCGDVWEALGLAYQQLGMLTAALKAYGRVIAIQGSCPIYAMQQSGNILLTLGLYRKAVNMFQTALEKTPGHLAGQYGLASALFGQARECMAMGAFDWSASLLKEASSVASCSAANNSNISSFWKLLGDIEATYARALPWGLSCQVSKGNCTSEASKIIKSEGFLAGKFGTSLDSWNKQRLLAAKNAKHAYQKALHLQPCKGNLYADLCLSFELVSSLDKSSNCSLSDWPAAMEAVACSGLSLESSNLDLWTALGVVARHKGIRQHALIQALRIDGNHAVAWAHLGLLYLKEGEEELARQAFDRARSADPTLALTWAAMSVIYSLTGGNHYQEAFASSLYAVQLSPMGEFQLGLAKIAATTYKLDSAEVYAAVEQAVLQAPHRPEAHNFKGLVCELKGNLGTAVSSFQLARDALDHSALSKSCLSDRRRAISINLARALCKVGDAHAAVLEYEKLAKSGNLEDSGALRGYAVALWQLGNKNLAVSIVKALVKKAQKPSATSAAVNLLCKFIYSISGPTSAMEELNNASKGFSLELDLALTAFAIASSAGRCEILLAMASKYDVFFIHEKAARFLLLVAAGMQLSHGTQGKLDYNSATQFLQKTLHMYPQSPLIRRRLMQILLERSNGREVDVAARCCYVNFLRLVKPGEIGPLCGMLGAASIACSVCGSIKPQSTFSSCSSQGKSLQSTVQELQRWLHLEPWNLFAHYYLVLSLMQEAREQRYPVCICQTLHRMAAIVLSRLPTGDKDGNPYEYMRLQLMLCSSESALQSGDNDLAVKNAKTAASLQVPNGCRSLAHLQLARCHAVRENSTSLEAEYQKCEEVCTGDSFAWLSMVDLKLCFGLQGASIASFENSYSALQERPSEEQRVWKAVLEFKRAEMYLRAQDLSSAEKAAAQAALLWPEAKSLHLLHGAICMEIVKSGSGALSLSSAVRSLSKVVSGGRALLPIACLLLAQAEAGKIGSGISKWEKYLRAEWSIWPEEYKPAELYFQMGLLAKKSKGTTQGDPEALESFQSSRSWFRRAVHLNPACIRYWAMLQHIEGNGLTNS